MSRQLAGANVMPGATLGNEQLLQARTAGAGYQDPEITGVVVPPGYVVVDKGITNGVHVHSYVTFVEEGAPWDVITQQEFEARKKAARNLQSLIHARNKRMAVYANRNARRGKRSFFFWNRPHDLGIGPYTKKALQESRLEMDQACARLIDFEKQLASEAGVSDEDIENYGEYFIEPDQKRLIGNVHEERMNAAAMYRNGFFTGTYYKWLDNQPEDTEFLSKVGILKKLSAAGYAALVVSPTLVATAFLGPVAGGAVAGVTASRVFHRRDQRRNSFNRVEEQTEELKQLPRADMQKTYEMIEAQTAKDTARNRRRIYSHIGAGALGGALGAGVEAVL